MHIEPGSDTGGVSAAHEDTSAIADDEIIDLTEIAADGWMRKRPGDGGTGKDPTDRANLTDWRNRWYPVERAHPLQLSTAS
jgi:hypothetical protein